MSVLSAPSADAASVDSSSQQPADETGKSADDVENKPPEVAMKDETSSNAEQKSADDGVKEDKGSNKNELALAYANRFLLKLY